MVVFVFILFLIWPFGGTIASLGAYNTKWTKNILWLFVIFYGYTFVLSNDTMDANRIKEKFEIIVNGNFTFGGLLRYYFLDNADGVDIIQPIIFYFVSKLTSNFYALMAVLGAIFGYFYSRNISYLLDRRECKLNWYNVLLLYLFAIIISFWDINRFRFATATMVFFYATIPYLYENRRRSLWFVPLSFLIHFSYLFPTIVLLIYMMFKNKAKWYFVFFIVSFFIASIDATMVGEFLLSLLPSNFHYKVMAYTNESYVQEQAENAKSFSYLLRYTMFFIINSLFVIFYLRYKDVIKSSFEMDRLFCFSLLIMAAANFISIIPSGMRFMSLSALYSITFLFFYFQRYGLLKREKLFLHISVPVFILSSFGYIRLGLNTIDIVAIVGNPVVAFFNDSRVALIELF